MFVFASNMLGPLYALYVSDIDSRVLSVSLSWSAFLFSTVLFTLLISEVGDKVEHKYYMLVAGFFIRALVWFSYIFIHSIGLLIVVQILLGLGEALGTPSFDAIFAEHLDSGKHIADYAQWKIISSLGGAVAIFLGGLLVDAFGFDYLFFIMSLLAAIAGLGVLTNFYKDKSV